MYEYARTSRGPEKLIHYYNYNYYYLNAQIYMECDSIYYVSRFGKVGFPNCHKIVLPFLCSSPQLYSMVIGFDRKEY